jgi:hypothetical protein
MTSLAELTDDRIELNSDVPFPPFAVWLRLPAAWSRLDSDPATWRRSADGLIDTTFRGSRLPTKERRDIVALLEGLVADCQRAGAALSLLTVGRRAAGGAASFGLHLAFAGDGRPASVGRVHDMLPRTGVATQIDADVGPAVLHRDRMTMVVPGTAEIAVLTTIQAFVPIPDTTWTVVLSSASAYPELTDALEYVVRDAAESVRTEPALTARDKAADAGGMGGANMDSADMDGGSAVHRLAVERPPAPGIERGFGTMLLRRIERPSSGPPSSGPPSSGPTAPPEPFR